MIKKGEKENRPETAGTQEKRKKKVELLYFEEPEMRAKGEGKEKQGYCNTDHRSRPATQHVTRTV